VFNQLGLTRACLESLRSTTGAFEVCVVDNGSSDETRAYFETPQLPYPLTYLRNEDNVGLIRGLNQGARLARGEFVCFMHNDTEMRHPQWLERLQDAVESGPRIGLCGLYGARKLRADGRYAGRSLLHSLEGSASLKADLAEVAAVDGVCLFLRRSLLESLGGFDEGYGFFHGYDRDLSFAVREAGWRCAVINAPFVHRGGGTRAAVGAPHSAEQDMAARRQAMQRFAQKWAHRLPCDVRTLRQRLGDWLVAPGALSC
jgi:O-antigen biosynthesis protein